MVVVTYGELPFANSDWYFENVFLRRAKKRLKPPIYPSPNMQRRPMVVSLPTLELLIQAVNSTRTSFLSLYDDKQERSYVSIGDWDTYLRSKLSEIKATPEPLPFIEEEFDAFFETLGVPRGASSSAGERRT
jgi:hypothetical protein